MQKNKIKEYCDDINFCNFVIKEFESTATNATIEELAEFAFGDIRYAIKRFESIKKLQ